jgi:hypothetical protein
MAIACDKGRDRDSATATQRRTSAAGRVQDAASDLILFDRFEQGLEVAFTETVIALSLDKLEEDGPDCRPAKALQQHLC